ncbi:endogenous retrovirus group PABLB member 1 Env polyprotein-like [Anomaloglossus baeobatrachus]|uniref:endogenous retrovirus group PABLB member 1 Env polyprotein-like n=1 Tax=Anomaloglossus baeobatrachus TaxID=238106 RepID=UPI003F4FA085
MGPCQPLQEGLILLISISMCTPFLGPSTPRQNSFETHHEVLAEKLEITDCWICTHAPVTASSMPYLAIPVPINEVFQWGGCYNRLSVNDTKYQKLWNTSVPIPIVGWVDFPWWQGNLTTGLPGTQQYLAFEGSSWVPRNYTKTPIMGKIPTEGIKISFGRTSDSTDAFKPLLLERHLHDHGWIYNSLFPEGTNDTCYSQPGNLWCNDSDPYVPGRETCGEPSAGYCSPLGQLPGWCILRNISAFIDIVHRLILQHSAIWDLPPQTYWVCGYNAYKWLPVGVNGTCTLARLTPATFIINTTDIPAGKMPLHLLVKRAADNKDRPSGRPHVIQMSHVNKFFSSLFIYPMIMQMYDKLVDSTDYLDDQIFEVLQAVNSTIAIQRQLIIVTNQHTLVLDYLTAAQGGMCQVVGPSCCHYIDPKGTLRAQASLTEIQKLRKKHDEEVLRSSDAWWSNTFSMFNPANWFKGIGGWFMGILQSVFQVLLCLVVAYVVFKLLMALFSRCLKQCRYNDYSAPV